ncbi:hypothetical protein QJS10_CPB22g00924 [Acorus calamus]|uniref:Peptidase M14 domain-containing protein n=1 Tax=Acorus calamus TaxID=4465 RepID=A0AAV9C0S4_ACOCL|nr:hypothetical protein QJS10_CPB22g00924 [Acorus calamus]
MKTRFRDLHLPAGPMGCSALSLILPFAALLLASPSPTPAAARGGERDPKIEGFMDSSHMFSSRHLFEESQSQIGDIVASGYMSNSELEDAMKDFVRRCHNISRMYSIGRSVQNVPLWVIEISDKPGQEEAEPAFKFIGNVHGDEPVGRELLISLANWLCDNYMNDDMATMIVKNVHLHILPSMNPDGFSLRKRNNANNVDLNRDFPDQFFHANDDVASRQPETKAVMRWVKEGHFTASASLHGGALVANYPWDGSTDSGRHYYACPDDKAFRYLASVYSNTHHNMSQSLEFRGGITNGALWYPIYGGMQDWNYIHGGCFELTLEISDNKWPNANELPVLWEYNKMSMLNLVGSLVKTGVHGRIVSSSTGHPLPATVMIKGINYNVSAGKIFGDYHRMLTPYETYEVTASTPGFQSKTTHISLEGGATSVDFILSPEEDESSGRPIDDCDCRGVTKREFEQVEVSGVMNWVVYLSPVILLLGLLYFLLRRKSMSKPVRQRESAGNKRSIVV